jgi:ribosomal protein L37AE/L43A
MPPARRCSECGESLAGKGPQARTCSDNCRGKRSRRLRRQSQESTAAARAANSYPDHAKQFSDVIKYDQEDVAREVMAEELRPVVREAITEDVLRGIQRLLAITPKAIECMADDLDSEDATIRQRAYSLIAKYTLGQSGMVNKDDGAQAGMVVHFNLPRPGDEVTTDGAAVELEDDELRQCDTCGQDKPITEFIAGSYRCATCYDAQRERAQRLLES